MKFKNWKFWNVMKYPHTVICLIIHLAVCVFLFWKFVINDPSNYNRFEELLVELHLLAQYFAKMFCFYCHLLCDVVKENYCHTTSEIFDCIAGGGGWRFRKKNRKDCRIIHIIVMIWNSVIWLILLAVRCLLTSE